MVQRLPWDFRTTFPQPTPEAIEAGVVSDEDTEPESVKAIHEEHARELLMTLHDLDAVLDARRRGVDPRNNKAPMLAEAKERLEKFFETEPARLERWFTSLMGSYESAFGPEAADAFSKAVRAWHAGIEVVGPEHRQSPATKVPAVRRIQKVRASSALPVPRPLRASVAAGIFGCDEDSKPIRPDAAEVRAITEEQAERMVEMNDGDLHIAVAKYAEDFGPKAAAQLERYVRRQQHSR